MQIKKLPKLFIALSVIVVGVVISLALLVQDVERVWNMTDTFEESAVLKIPSPSDNTAIEDTEIAGEVTYKVPYCLLYETVISDSAITYNCSYLPEYYTSLQKFNYTEIRFTPDVSLLVKNEDPLPTAFLSRSGISKETIGSFGATAVPVSLEVTVRQQKLEKNISTMIKHYWGWRVSQKLTPSTDTLVSWQVTKLPSELTDLQLKNWAEAALDDVNTMVGNEVLKKKTGQELINYFAGKFANQTAYCSPYIYPCFPVQAENAAPNILYYLYILQEKNDSLATKFITEAKNRVLPFVLEKNKDFKVKEVLCSPTDPECQVDYQDMQAYQFPICPVKQIAKGQFDHPNVKLFMDFQKEYSTKAGVPYAKSKASVIELLQGMASSRSEKMAEKHVLDPQEVLAINDLCYGIVLNKMSDAKTVADLQQTYINIISQRYAHLADGAASLERPMKFEDFKKYVAASYYQAGESPMVPDEAEAYKEMYQGINSRSQAVFEKKYIGSIALTLFLIYLYQ